MKKAILLIGPPGSGKTTWASTLLAQGWAHISTDRYIENVAQEKGATYGEVFQREIKNAERDMKARLAEVLAQGDDLVWDQTNMTRKSRMKKVSQLTSAGYTVKAHVFMIDPVELGARQLKRAIETGKVIPQRIVDQMLEYYEEPIFDEGYVEITFHLK